MASVTVADQSTAKPKQNWIVDPLSDAVFIIGAPILAFAWALMTLRVFGAEIVWNIFIIFNIAHHFPTFIRIYGDKDCFRRFRWSLILGPIIPFSAGLLLSYYTVSNGYPVQTLFFVLMVLTLWDPWHFLMQHYGFMRIYDRHNSAPAKLAAWMDYAISVSWFAFIMLATSEWFIEKILYTLFNDNGLPFLLWIDPSVYNFVIQLSLALAVAASFAYLGYMLWCWRKGYFVSPAKICLLLCTFGMMYVTYVPNSFLRANYPEWHFGVGFATLGMVHVTQYLAIVWKYNRGLAKRGEERSRAGVFTDVFSRGGLVIAAMYVAVCLIYGALFSNDSPVVSGLQGAGVPGSFLTGLSCLIVTVGFTSTFMHYYYDGFIWKFRHKENRENLEDDERQNKAKKTKGKQGRGAAARGDFIGTSWWERISEKSLWERFRGQSFSATLLRQVCYFGIPIGFLVVTFFYVGQMPRSTAHQAPTMEAVSSAQENFQRDPSRENLATLESLIDRVDRQILAEEQMIQLNPVNREWHQQEVALLTYTKARGDLSLQLARDELNGNTRQPTSDELEAYRARVESAIEILENQLPSDPSLMDENQQELSNYVEQWKVELAQPAQ